MRIAFIEVKAAKGKITMSYGKYQIAGMLDVLSQSQAAKSSDPIDVPLEATLIWPEGEWDEEAFLAGRFGNESLQ